MAEKPASWIYVALAAFLTTGGLVLTSVATGRARASTGHRREVPGSPLRRAGGGQVALAHLAALSDCLPAGVGI
jgi:hypothetical protein